MENGMPVRTGAAQTVYRWKVVRTIGDLNQAQRLRYEGYERDLGISIAVDPRVERDVSSHDTLDTAIHVLVYQGLEPIGTARLALADADVARASRTDLGFELEREFELSQFAAMRSCVAEVARVCVVRRFHGTRAVPCLYEALFALSREHGIRYWVGGVDCQTSCAEEATRIHADLAQQGLVSSSLRVKARGHHTGSKVQEGGQTSRRALPSSIAAFVRSLGAKCLGAPGVHPAFPRYVLPMFVDLDALPAATLAHFDCSLLPPKLTPPRPSLSAPSAKPQNGGLHHE
jgi:L-ornithine Nalpha-acyltransferase